MNETARRLDELREAFDAAGVDALLVPSSDEHLNEYLPEWTRRRQFLSGFTGSAGDLLVTRDGAWLATDSRYHIQAATELAGSGIDLLRVGDPGVPTLLDRIESLAREESGFRLGADPSVLPLAGFRLLASRLQRAAGRLVPVGSELVDALWTERPAAARGLLTAWPLEWGGETVSSKVERLRRRLTEGGAQAHACVKLDDIAWLLNLRSYEDVPYNPVFEAFLLVTGEELHVFLRGGTERLPRGYDPGCPLHVHELESWEDFLADVEGEVLVDPWAVTAGTAQALEAGGAPLVEAEAPIEALKAIKNAAEAAAMREANLLASVAKTKALLWLREQLAAGRSVTEASFRERLEEQYRALPGYRSLSFNTISATGAHGAIVHYGAADATPLEDGHLFLVDSGAQIGGGTTDDTRTVPVGRIGTEERRVYTLVLEGHVRAARQRFPKGVGGAALDALARSPLWSAGLHYDHGTGHGVGAGLCVHEGPFALSERRRRGGPPTPLAAGHVTSIEPGCYLADRFGVRIENLYLIGGSEDTQGRTWLEPECLTWIPLEPRLIDQDLLSAEARSWVAAYHDACREKLAPHLEEKERDALEIWISGK